MGIDGVGWGTAVTKDRVWISSFNGKILVMDFDGKPVATENDFPFKEKFLGLMGIGVADNRRCVDCRDGSDNQLLFFPEGRIKDGRIVKVGAEVALRHCHRLPESRVGCQLRMDRGADTDHDPTKVESFRAGSVPVPSP